MRVERETFGEWRDRVLNAYQVGLVKMAAPRALNVGSLIDAERGYFAALQAATAGEPVICAAYRYQDPAMPRVILTYADWDRIATALEGWVDEVGSEQVAGFEETRDKVLALIEEVNACGIETTDEAC